MTHKQALASYEPFGLRSDKVFGHVNERGLLDRSPEVRSEKANDLIVHEHSAGLAALDDVIVPNGAQRRVRFDLGPVG